MKVLITENQLDKVFDRWMRKEYPNMIYDEENESFHIEDHNVMIFDDSDDPGGIPVLWVEDAELLDKIERTFLQGEEESVDMLYRWIENVSGISDFHVEISDEEEDNPDEEWWDEY